MSKKQKQNFGPGGETGFSYKGSVELKVYMRIVWHQGHCGSGFSNRADCKESGTAECNDCTADNLTLNNALRKKKKKTVRTKLHCNIHKPSRTITEKMGIPFLHSQCVPGKTICRKAIYKESK